MSTVHIQSGKLTCVFLLIYFKKSYSFQADCTNQSIELIVTSNVLYYNRTVFTRFINDHLIQPTILNLDFEFVTTIEDNAFADGSFELVTNLTIHNLRILTLGPSTFVGLNSLRILNLLTLQLLQLPDCLHGVASSLQQLLITNGPPSVVVQQQDMFNLDGPLTGVQLPSLQSVQFRVNLQTSLIEDAFISTARLSSLNLANCQIETIYADVFFSIRDSVREINLRGNAMKTLPTGMFSYLLPRESLLIDLTHNPWDCSCHLSELRKNLRMYQINFVADPVCVTPLEFLGLTIMNAPFCGKITNNITDDDPTTNFMVVRCPMPHPANWTIEKVERNREVQFRVVHERHTVNAALHIRPNDDGEEMRMVAFTALQQSDILVVNYRCKCNNTPISLNQRLKIGLLYVLCVQHKSTRMTIPQNCISYQLGNNHLNGWLLQSDGLLVGCVLAGINVTMLGCGGLVMVLLYGRFVGNPVRCSNERVSEVQDVG